MGWLKFSDRKRLRSQLNVVLLSFKIREDDQSACCPFVHALVEMPYQ